MTDIKIPDGPFVNIMILPADPGYDAREVYNLKYVLDQLMEHIDDKSQLITSRMDGIINSGLTIDKGPIRHRFHLSLFTNCPLIRENL